MSLCQVVNCTQDAKVTEITFDCGKDDPNQIINICKVHQESHDVMPDGSKFYIFKQFAISWRDL